MAKKQATHHKQISIYNPYFDEDIDVDEGLAGVLRLIWQIGINTGYSCQERNDMPGMTMINFRSVYDAEKFVSTVVKYVPKVIDHHNETTYQRIIRFGCRKCWKFEVFPETGENLENVNEIYFSSTVFFPVEDLPVVIGSLWKAALSP